MSCWLAWLTYFSPPSFVWHDVLRYDIKPTTRGSICVNSVSSGRLMVQHVTFPHSRCHIWQIQQDELTFQTFRSIEAAQPSLCRENTTCVAAKTTHRTSWCGSCNRYSVMICMRKHWSNPISFDCHGRNTKHPPQNNSGSASIGFKCTAAKTLLGSNPPAACRRSVDAWACTFHEISC